jgi:uncharacterized repeat protein (TIGR01451 family)
VTVPGGAATVVGCNLLLSGGQLTGTLEDGTAINVPASVTSPGVLNLQGVPAQLTCPANVTVAATSAAGATVNYPAPALSASCPGTTVVCSPAPGSTFPIGTTTVTCTARDANMNPSGSCSFQLTVLPSADLAVVLAASPNPTHNKQNLTYTIAVSNAGPTAASGVTITDAIPAGCTFVSASATGGVVLSTPAAGGNGTVQGNLASLASGSSVKVTLTVKPNTTKTTISDTATVSAGTSDPNGANNSATIAVAVK